MKNIMLYIVLVFFCSNGLVKSAHADLIHNFYYELDDWNSSLGFQDGDYLQLIFKDDTNFNNVQVSDILSFQYMLTAGETEKYLADDFRVFNGGDFSNAFSVVNDSLFLEYSGVYQVAGYLQASKSGLFAQFIPGQTTQVFTHYRDVNGARQNALLRVPSLQQDIVYQSQQVIVSPRVAADQTISEPASLWLFLLAPLFLLLHSANRKHKA